MARGREQNYAATNVPKIIIMTPKSMRSRKDIYASEGTWRPTIARNRESRDGDGLDPAYAGRYF